LPPGLIAALPPTRPTSQPGSYLLLLWLGQPFEARVGRLGSLRLAAGWYVYVGSALGGLSDRLRRHLRRGKPLRWHVDTLREHAELLGVAFRVGRERLECAMAVRLAGLPGAGRPVPRFGASDCRCAGHLVHFSARPDLPLEPGWVLVWLASRPIPIPASSPLHTT
jgi:sugar fermentation stimulation protein A